ncbi:MAG: PIN domain nuclease [Oscillospiraceae bacterium]|jgi:predicted nucleic acid-binding protein|nr:PIN domain nuclease [Oscillospiraceae bacterium]
MRRRLYLDTSAVSYLRQEDAPDKMAQTRAFWEILKTGKYDAYISDVTIKELSRCAEPKRRELLALLGEIRYNYTEAAGNETAAAIAAEIKTLGVLPSKSESDRRHIAAAVCAGCHVIVSWNFEHIVNERTADALRILCFSRNLAPVVVRTPAMMTERRTADGKPELRRGGHQANS